MMNKKAIAAFAAGATLLAGFAMATPAMAAKVPATDTERTQLAQEAEQRGLGFVANNIRTSKTSSYQELKAMLQKAEDEQDAAESHRLLDYPNDTLNNSSAEGVAAEARKRGIANPTVDEFQPDLLAQYAGTRAEKLGKAYNDLLDGKITEAQYQAVKKAVFGSSEYTEDSLDSKQDDKQAPKKDDKKDDTTTPDEKIKDLGKLNLSDAAKKKLAAHYVYEAKLALDEADNNLAEKKADYAAKKKALLDAQAELTARDVEGAAANQALTDFLASGENNSAKETALRDAVNRANAHEQRAFDAWQKAKTEFDAARDAAFAAVAAYNKALAEYKDAYNDAVRLGVNPAALPPVVTSDPLAADFPAVPGTKQIYADALNGKFGPAAQASAKKTEVAKAQAAAPAAAKGELAAKGGHGKSGEKLGNAGVGVALTALAASMLAGMGAAVRKMRH
ncbi:hypothetical protein [Gardnerella vaginalis]|uniref:hypothetical protein n=1 Tax=Gardnerella vaginalis TaxID=2702 RepID=UPI003970E134